MVEYHKVFKGEVKVSDVQEAFDDMVNRINNIIFYYNSLSYVTDIDFSKGATSLAPAGYTLSVGGLKQLLNTYSGCVIGCKPFRVSTNKIVMTEGILIMTDNVYRLPSAEITISNSTATIYYDFLAKEYRLSSNNSSVKVCDVNMKSESDYVRTTSGILCQDFDGEYSVTVESQTFGAAATGNPVYPDTSKSPKFVSAIDAQRFERDGTAHTYLFGTEVAYNEQKQGNNKSRCLNYWTPINFLFLPKGIGNPYNVTNGDATKTFNAKIEKKLE